MVRELYFFHEYRCYVTRWVVDLTKEAMAAHWQDLLEHPEYKPEYAVLHDLRACGIRADYSDSVESQDLYARDVAPRVGCGRVAILVDNAAAFGTGRQLTVMVGLEEESRVTYAEDDAKAWVGLPAGHVLPYASDA